MAELIMWSFWTFKRQILKSKDGACVVIRKKNAVHIPNSHLGMSTPDTNLKKALLPERYTSKTRCESSQNTQIRRKHFSQQWISDQYWIINAVVRCWSGAYFWYFLYVSMLWRIL